MPKKPTTYTKQELTEFWDKNTEDLLQTVRQEWILSERYATPVHIVQLELKVEEGTTHVSTVWNHDELSRVIADLYWEFRNELLARLPE